MMASHEPAASDPELSQPPFTLAQASTGPITSEAIPQEVITDTLNQVNSQEMAAAMDPSASNSDELFMAVLKDISTFQLSTSLIINQ